MGLSATQARWIVKNGELNDLEYQGQQINQQRSVLGVKASALTSSLLDMKVPTPPAVSDFMTIKYTGTMGATTYTFDASTVRPNGDKYSITLQQSCYGDTLQKNSRIVNVDNQSQGTFRGQIITDVKEPYYKKGTVVTTGDYKIDSTGNTWMNKVSPSSRTINNEDGTSRTEQYYPSGTYYQFNADTQRFIRYSGPLDPAPEGGLYKASTQSEGSDSHQVSGYTYEEGGESGEQGAIIARADISDIYIYDGTSVKQATIDDFDKVNGDPSLLRFRTNGTQYVRKSDNGQLFNEAGNVAGWAIDNKGFHELGDDEKAKYGEAIANSGLKDASGNPYTVDDFYIYTNDKGTATFVLKSDVHDGNDNAVTYTYSANGNFMRNQDFDDVMLTFDPTNGRITEIAIPNGDGSYTSIAVKATEVKDEAAYDDAYSAYEYETYLYEHKIQEINAELSIIQQQDKTLELKLQELDNKRTEITTEIEALKKVMNDDIESSFKTFSG